MSADRLLGRRGSGAGCWCLRARPGSSPRPGCQCRCSSASYSSRPSYGTLWRTLNLSWIWGCWVTGRSRSGSGGRCRARRVDKVSPRVLICCGAGLASAGMAV